MSDIALRRAASLGDGWLAIAGVDNLDPPALRTAIDRITMLRADKGDSPFELVLKLEADGDLAAGLPQAVARAGEMGFDELVIDVPWEQGIDRAREVFRECRDAAGLH
jgi:hypothetical protein